MGELAMTARILASARSRVPRRLLALTGLASAVLAVAISHALPTLAGSNAGSSSAGATSASHNDAASLSPAARASISAALGADEQAYHFTSAAGGFRAANVAQNLAITAGRAGVTVRDRRLDLGLGLQAIGYGDSLAPARTATPREEANRVTYAGSGVSAWYANGPFGLEQGFTVARAPGRAAGGPLTLAMMLSGNARATLAADGRSVAFTAAGGVTVRYGGLSVTDAAGRTLRSWLVLDGRRLLLRVDTDGARFPLRVDPIVEAEKQLTPKPGEETARAGVSVALSANSSTALVGAPAGGNGGAVWVFTREPGGVEYVQSEELTVEDAEAVSIFASCGEHVGDEEDDECRFGSSVAISADGETAAVGAPGANNREGSVYMFTRSGTTWQGVEVPSPEPVPGGLFGRSVALSADGGKLLVGAPGERGGRGQAWVFTGSGMTWSKQGEALTSQGEEHQAHFGKSVALAGNGEVALIGAPDEAEHQGGAWAFETNSSGEFLVGSKLPAAGVDAQGRFGSSVALSEDGDTALVGAPYQEGAGGLEGTGAVWAYTRAGSHFSELQPTLTGAGEVNELFGYSVALSPDGTTAVVGAPRGREGDGEAWLYESSGTSWGSATEELVGREEDGKERFGKSVATSAGGEIVLLGAPGNGGREGAAWVFGPGPAIRSVSPDSGAPQGGTTVTIEGQHFAGATEVRFGASKADFQLDPDGTTITAVSPPGTGIVPITVTTPAGESEAANPKDEFTYERPTVASVTPNSGTRDGGTEVTIEGTFLAGATKVRFGSKEAKFTVESPDAVRASSPAEAAGVVDITVTTPAGESEVSAADRFTFTPHGESTGTREEEPKKSEGGSSGANGTGGTGQGGVLQEAGQVLALGPVSAGVCGASLISKKIGVVHDKLALFRLVGTGAGSCSGKLRLRVRVKLGHGRFLLKTIGTAVFSISSGRRVSVSVKLNRAGRALLRADHGHLNASVLLVKSSPLPSLARTASVRLAPQRTAKPKPKPKTP
jgi:hypothetical protein